MAAELPVILLLPFNCLDNLITDTTSRNVLTYSKQVKPVFSGHSKIDKIKVLKTNGSLMKVKSIRERSLNVSRMPIEEFTKRDDSSAVLM